MTTSTVDISKLSDRGKFFLARQLAQLGASIMPHQLCIIGRLTVDDAENLLEAIAQKYPDHFREKVLIYHACDDDKDAPHVGSASSFDAVPSIYICPNCGEAVTKSELGFSSVFVTVTAFSTDALSELGLKFSPTIAPITELSPLQIDAARYKFLRKYGNHIPNYQRVFGEHLQLIIDLAIATGNIPNEIVDGDREKLDGLQENLFKGYSAILKGDFESVFCHEKL